MDLVSSIMIVLFVVAMALGIMTYWENRRWTARFRELMEKDFREELNEEEMIEFQEMLSRG